MTDLTGKTFNSWTVLAFSHRNARNQEQWMCRCKCGTEKVVAGYNLTGLRTKSCRPCSAAVVGAEVHRTHGMSRTKVYRAWQSMKTRCYNENAEECFKYHGKRGIKVCDEWLDDFDAFYTHIGDPPNPLYTVDRIDTEGDYRPGNVRWATQAEQNNNKRAYQPRKKRKLTLFG